MFGCAMLRVGDIQSCRPVCQMWTTRPRWMTLILPRPSFICGAFGKVCVEINLPEEQAPESLLTTPVVRSWKTLQSEVFMAKSKKLLPPIYPGEIFRELRDASQRERDSGRISLPSLN